jgi:hypothetical protein
MLLLSLSLIPVLALLLQLPSIPLLRTINLHPNSLPSKKALKMDMQVLQKLEEALE